jgi:hypothetical protein
MLLERSTTTRSHKRFAKDFPMLGFSRSAMFGRATAEPGHNLVV